MKLSEKKTGNFVPHPECEDPIKAVIVDITEPKERQTKFGLKEEIRIVFETEVMDDENDRRFCIWSRGYVPSLHEKAALRKDLKKILGRELTKAELEEFDLECLLGHAVKLIVQHEHVEDKTYANISFITADKDKTKLKPSGKYKRTKDRDDKKDAADDEQETETSWQDVVVHIGKHKGKKLGDLSPEAGAMLIEKWLPNAKAAKNQEDADLVKALSELESELSAAEDY